MKTNATDLALVVRLILDDEHTRLKTGYTAYLSTWLEQHDAAYAVADAALSQVELAA